MGTWTQLKIGISVGLLVLSSLFCHGAVYEGVEAGNRCVNRKLSMLAVHLPELGVIRQDTIMQSALLPVNKSLVVRFNHDREIEHLGVSLFSKETKKMLDETVCDFLERFFLELLVQESGMDVKRKLIEYHIAMKFNGLDFGSGRFQSVYSWLEELTMPVEFRLIYENKKGLATWSLKGEKTLSVLFPMSAELIIGMDKKEADYQLYQRLLQVKQQADDGLDHAVEADELERENAHVYVKRGAEYLIPKLNADCYFEKQGDTVRPLYSADYPAESLKTLFHSYANGRTINLCITHRQYGHFTPEILLPLNNFLSLFRKKFEIYTAAMKRSNQRVEVLVVIRHKNLNYIHLMRVKADTERLSSKTLTMTADFYSNIPQHYIKSLFTIK